MYRMFPIILCLILTGLVNYQLNKQEVLDSNLQIPIESPSTTFSESESEHYNYSDNSQQDKEQYLQPYPIGIKFIESIIEERGHVAITNDMRELFNTFAREYRWCYIPDMDGYESFFDTTNNINGYTKFANAVFYIMQYMKCPEKVSEEEMQRAIQYLFVVKDSIDKDVAYYEDMPHQDYRKLANYQDGYYSPWEEGGFNHSRMFYLLTSLDIVQKEENDVYIIIHAKNYYFHDINGFASGANEKWLAEKAKKLGLPDVEAASQLISSGKMDEIEGDREFETTLYIKYSGHNPYGNEPRFVSNRSRSIAYDEPFSENE